MGEHTYFLKAMDWAAAGTYYDEAHNAFPLRGSVRILREPEWTLNGLLEVRSHIRKRIIVTIFLPFNFSISLLLKS